MAISSRNCFSLTLLLLAIFVRGLIPAGFMPDTSQKVALTICSGMTTKTIFVDQTTPSDQHDQDKDHQPCPFALPLLANGVMPFAVLQYISIAYAPFHPHQAKFPCLHKILLKSFFSQGPPAAVSA